MKKISCILWSLGFLMALITGAGAKTIHVATTGDDTSGDGSSGNPYQTIQKGIDEAAIFGDKVDVAAGTYRESLFWDVKSLILQGAGTGSTIVDGDLDGDGSRDARCLYTRNVDDKARVTGITFQNGYAGDYAHGGGIYLESSDLTLMDSEIKDSNAYYRGGGLYLQGGAPILNDNLIQNNVASWQTGGGLYVDQSAASLTSNEITTNTAHDQGGGLYLYQSAASLTDNEITDNTAGNRGGGVYILQSSASLTGNSISGNHVTNENGGGVYLRSASATLTGNEITSNQADSGAGGGVFMETSGDTLDGNLISGNIAITVAGGCYLWDTDNATLVNNLIVANYAADSGAGIFLHLSDSPLTNNTVADNWGEGILGSSDPGSPIITNGVFWGNDDDLVGVTATYSDIGTGETAGTGNISADPLFKGGSDPWYAYDLQDVSPCLNVGDNTVDPLPEKDVHGDPRVLEGTVDMGADEQLHFSAVRQPDLWIKQGSNWLGDDLYHEDGTDQRGTRNVVTGATAVYQARLYNDGTKAATIWIKGPAGSDNCVVRYYRGTTVNPDRDVTDLVTSSKGWKRAQVPIGGKQAFLIAVTPGPGLRKNFEFGVVARSQRDPGQVDGIQTRTRVLNLQPDLLIKKGKTWLGNNVYNEDGTDQKVTLAVAPGATKVYRAQMSNDGNKAETFIIQGPGGNADWTVRYYRGTVVREDREVTSQVTRPKGWKRPNVAPGKKSPFLITVTPSSALTEGLYPVLVRAESQQDAYQRDAIQVSTRVKTE